MLCPRCRKKAERAKQIIAGVTIKLPVTIKTEKRQRGGRRPGAGRKPSGGSEAVRKRVAAHRARKRAAQA
jgi:hypothetical protein